MPPRKSYPVKKKSLLNDSTGNTIKKKVLRVESFKSMYPDHWVESNLSFIYKNKLYCNHIIIISTAIFSKNTSGYQKQCVKISQ